jgi:pantoate kinase
MREATAFAPGHLTGLFQICDQPKDPLKKGARGSGVSLKLGTQTKVQVEPSSRFKTIVMINGIKSAKARISQVVLSKYKPLLTKKHKITVSHQIQTPMTAGFGSSGGGALSLSLALNEALDTGLTFNESAQIAHITEIECGTGLGSVFAAASGGFGVLYKPGAPGIGKALTYAKPEDYSVVYLYLGTIRTKEALSNPELRKRINLIGGDFVDELFRKLTPERFMRYSRNFTEYVELVTPRLRRLFNATDDVGYLCTMAMFGEVLFTLLPKGDENHLIELLNKMEPTLTPVKCDIDKQGAKLI